MRIVRTIVFALAAIATLALPVPSIAGAKVIEDRTLSVDGQTFRYLAAGTQGRPIVLLHGWPQSADEFRKIIPKLATDHQVYAPDLSGVGGTTAPGKDGRKDALARDVKRFVDALRLERPIIVGHDIGGMVAYAYSRQFPETLSGVVILDVPIPGLAPWEDVVASHHAWHFEFHNQKGLAEDLVQGRQAEYFRYFINRNGATPNAISDDDVALFAKAYGTRDQLRAGFEFYRAFGDDAEFFKSHNKAFGVPMLVVGGEYSMQATLPVMAKSFSALGATNVRTVAIARAGHWLAEEQPDATAGVISKFAIQLDER